MDRVNSARLNEFQRMLNSLRVAELKKLLETTPCQRLGRKAELVERAIMFIQNNPQNKNFQNSIRELHNRKLLAQRSRTTNSAPSEPILLPMAPNLPGSAEDFVPLPGRPRTAQQMQQSRPGPSHPQAMATPLPSTISNLQQRTAHPPVPANTGGAYDVRIVNGVMRYQPRNRESPPADPGFESDLPLRPDVKLIQLPFYDVLDILLKPHTLMPSGKQHFQENVFTFSLSPQQLLDIQYESSKALPRMEVQMRICEMNSDGGPSKDAFPEQCLVKVNGKNACLPNFLPQAPNAGRPAQRLSRPVDVTSLIAKTDRRPQKLHVSWAYNNENKNYCITIIFVRHLTSTMLLERLKVKPQTAEGVTRSMIQNKLKDDWEDLAMTTFRLSLLCPLVKVRMAIPAKGTNCNHVQCFDAFSYLAMNEKRPTWMCAVCNRDAPYAELTIDSYLSRVLSVTDSNTPEIEIKQDGTWAPVKEEEQSDSEDEDSRAPLPTATKAETSATKSEPAVVDLDESVMIVDDGPSKSSKSRPQKDAAKPANEDRPDSVEVIDLSSSEDSDDETATTIVTGVHGRLAAKRKAAESDALPPPPKTKKVAASSQIDNTKTTQPEKTTEVTRSVDSAKGRGTTEAIANSKSEKSTPRRNSTENETPRTEKSGTSVNSPRPKTPPRRAEPIVVDLGDSPPKSESGATETAVTPVRSAANSVPKTESTPESGECTSTPETTPHRASVQPTTGGQAAKTGGNLGESRTANNVPESVAKTAAPPGSQLVTTSAVTNSGENFVPAPVSGNSVPPISVPTTTATETEPEPLRSPTRDVQRIRLLPAAESRKASETDAPAPTEKPQSDFEKKIDDAIRLLTKEVVATPVPAVDPANAAPTLVASRVEQIRNVYNSLPPPSPIREKQKDKHPEEPRQSITREEELRRIQQVQKPQATTNRHLPRPNVAQSRPSVQPRPSVAQTRPDVAQPRPSTTMVASTAPYKLTPTEAHVSSKAAVPSGQLPQSSTRNLQPESVSSQPANRIPTMSNSIPTRISSYGAVPAPIVQPVHVLTAQQTTPTPIPHTLLTNPSPSPLSIPGSHKVAAIDPARKKIMITPKPTTSLQSDPRPSRFSDKPEERPKSGRFSDQPPLPKTAPRPQPPAISSVPTISPVTAPTQNSGGAKFLPPLPPEPTATSRFSNSANGVNPYSGARSSSTDRFHWKRSEKEPEPIGHRPSPLSRSSTAPATTKSSTTSQKSNSRPPTINSVSKGSSLSSKVLGFDADAITRMIKQPQRKRFANAEAMDEVFAASEHTLATRRGLEEFTSTSSTTVPSSSTAAAGFASGANLVALGGGGKSLPARTSSREWLELGIPMDREKDPATSALEALAKRLESYGMKT